MEWLLELIRELQHHIDPNTIAAAGYLALIAVVFAETGLAVGFFLPGDSLLVVAGLFAARGDLDILILLSTLFVAAVVGDAVGYATGARLGPKLFSRPKSFLFRPAHLEKAKAFYDSHGGKTIIMARFVPILRTFVPIVAGAAHMPYRRFAIFNVTGGAAWVTSMLLVGYFLGSVVPGIDHHIEKVVIVVILLSFLPPVFEVWKARRRARREGPAPT